MGSSLSVSSRRQRANRVNGSTIETVDNTIPSTNAGSAAGTGNNTVMSTSTAVGMNNNTASPTESSIMHPRQMRLATSRRATAVLLSSKWLLLTTILLLLALIGNTSDKPVIRNTYFLSLSYIPTHKAGPTAEAIGNGTLHRRATPLSPGVEYRQLGLWNSCKGEFLRIHSCSPREMGYPFDPLPEFEHKYQVDLISNESLSQSLYDWPYVQEYHWRSVSQTMLTTLFGALGLSSLLVAAAFAAIYSRWMSALITLLTLLNALAVTALAFFSQWIFHQIKTNLHDRFDEMHICAKQGRQMFVFLWLAAASSFLAFLVHSGLICCGASWRDVKNGRKMGHKKAYAGADSEKGGR